MSDKTFTEKEVELLSQHKYVKNVSTKAITYTDEFKSIFIVENEKGKFSRDIFTDHGFDIDILGIERIKSSGNRWRAAYRNDGISGLRDTRKGNSGRPREKGLSFEEKYERLKAENELLKKQDMMERGLRKK